MTKNHEEIDVSPLESLESLWEKFERTGSVQAFLAFQKRLSLSSATHSEEVQS